LPQTNEKTYFGKFKFTFFLIERANERPTDGALPDDMIKTILKRRLYEMLGQTFRRNGFETNNQQRTQAARDFLLLSAVCDIAIILVFSGAIHADMDIVRGLSCQSPRAPRR
jgi:hypothetical protein